MLSNGHIYWKWSDPYPAICIYGWYFKRAIVDPVASRVRGLRLSEIAVKFVCSSLHRLIGLRVLRVITLEPEDIGEELDLASSLLTGVTVNADELNSLVAKHPGLSDDFLAR